MFGGSTSCRRWNLPKFKSPHLVTHEVIVLNQMTYRALSPFYKGGCKGGFIFSLTFLFPPEEAYSKEAHASSARKWRFLRFL